MPNKNNRKRKSDFDEISELKVKLKKLEQSMSRKHQHRRRRIRVISSSSDCSSTSSPENDSRRASHRRSSRSATRSSGRRRHRSRSRLRSRSPSRCVTPIPPTVNGQTQADRSDADSDNENVSSTPPPVRVVVEQAQLHAPPSTRNSIGVQPRQTSSQSAVVLREQQGPTPSSVEPDILPEVTETVPELSMDILEILGDDPSKSKTLGKDVQKDLAIRLEHIATNGLSKEIRKELREKYPIPGNCSLIDAPQINPEVKAAISETTLKRLNGMEQKQKQLASAISCLGEAITLLISQSNSDPSLLKLLMDASRILCDTQYSDSLTRRYFILASLKKDMKDQLLQTKVDTFLFGKNLSETLKSAKAISKSGADLKQTYAPSKQTSWKSSNKSGYKKNSLNSKTLPSNNKSTGNTRARAPAPKNQPVSSSKSSRPPPRRRRSHR